jgi:hypothetical protein
MRWYVGMKAVHHRPGLAVIVGAKKQYDDFRLRQLREVEWHELPLLDPQQAPHHVTCHRPARRGPGGGARRAGRRLPVETLALLRGEPAQERAATAGEAGIEQGERTHDFRRLGLEARALIVGPCRGPGRDGGRAEAGQQGEGKTVTQGTGQHRRQKQGERAEGSNESGGQGHGASGQRMQPAVR